jgi:hypothetical protein
VKLCTAKNEFQGATRTNSRGEFIFDNVSRGSYVIRVVRPNTRFTGERRIVVNDQTPLEMVEVLLQEPSDTTTIRGKVVEQGGAADDVEVRLVNSRNEVVARVRSSNGGRFIFAGVENGAYKLRAARASTPSAGEGLVVVKGLTPIQDFELVLEKGKDPKNARIEGRVVEGFLVQPGLPVRLVNAANKVIAITATDEQGRFEFEDLEKGAYLISARKSSSRTQGIRPAELAESQHLKDVEVKLYR